MNEADEKVSQQSSKIRKDIRTINKERPSSSIEANLKNPLEEKTLLKRLIIKSIIFNSDKAQHEETIFEIKKLINMNQKSVKERMKVVLLEVYICLIEYNSFNLKKFTTHLTNLLSKLENPDFSKESKFDENDISLFKKLLCNPIQILVRPLIKEEDLFLDFAKIFEDPKKLLNNFMNKEYLKCFVLFVAACVFAKKGVKKMMEIYLNQVKQKLDKYQSGYEESKDLKLSQLSTLNKSYIDEFSVVITKLIKYFHGEINDKFKLKYSQRPESSLSSTKNFKKQQSILQSSPRRNSSQNLVCVKKPPSVSKVSDYQKYIKNINDINNNNISFYSPNEKKSNSLINSKPTKSSFSRSKHLYEKRKIINIEDDSISSCFKQHNKTTINNDFSVILNTKSSNLNKEIISGADTKKKSIDNVISNINGQLKIFEKCICEFSEHLFTCKKSFEEIDD